MGKLNYVSFGYWALVGEAQGTYSDFPFSDLTFPFKGSALADEGFFYKGTPANYDRSNLGKFTGIAAGTAEYLESRSPVERFGVTPLIGTAELTITSATNGALVLEFPNFYRFTGSINTSSNGWITGSFTGLQKLGSAFPVDLPATISEFNDNNIRGQLYGATPTNPTEAAGSWRLSHFAPTRDIHINGVFGVKK